MATTPTGVNAGCEPSSVIVATIMLANLGASPLLLTEKR